MDGEREREIMELERWFSSYEHMLLFQQTKVHFLASISDTSQLPVRAPTGLTSTCTHVHIITHIRARAPTQLKIKLKKQLSLLTNFIIKMFQININGTYQK